MLSQRMEIIIVGFWLYVGNTHRLSEASVSIPVFRSSFPSYHCKYLGYNQVVEDIVLDPTLSDNVQLSSLLLAL